MSTPILCHWNFFAVLLGAAGVYCEVYKTKSFVPTKSSVLSQACSCVCGLWKYDQRGLFGRGIPELDIKMCSSWFNSDKNIYDNNSYLSFPSEATLGATAVIGSFPWKCDFISILFIKLLQTWDAKYFLFFHNHKLMPVLLSKLTQLENSDLLMTVFSGRHFFSTC